MSTIYYYCCYYFFSCPAFTFLSPPSSSRSTSSSISLLSCTSSNSIQINNYNNISIDKPSFRPSLAHASASTRSSSSCNYTSFLFYYSRFISLHAPICHHRSGFNRMSEGYPACNASYQSQQLTGAAFLAHLLHTYECFNNPLQISPSPSSSPPAAAAAAAAAACLVCSDGGSTSEQNLVAAVAVLESIGVSRNKILSIYECQEQLFRTTPVGDILSRIELLEGFGMNRYAIAEAVQRCLPLVFSDLRTKLQPLLLLLQTLQIDKNPLVGTLLKYNPHKVISSAEPSVLRFLEFCSKYSIPVEESSLCIKKYPLVVIFSSDNMYRIVDFLAQFNMGNAGMGMLLRRDPRFLTRNVENSMMPTVDFLMKLGVDRDGVATIIRKQPNLFGFSVEMSLKPKIEFLQDVGFKDTDLTKLLTAEPAVLTRSITDCLDSEVRVLQALGFEMGSLTLGRALSFAYSTSVDYLEERVNWFKSVGFSREEIYVILKCNPSVLRCKTVQLQTKLAFLVNTMQYALKDIVAYPQFLSLSLEKRIIPRYKVMVWLKSENILERNPALPFFTRLTYESFQKKYVDPNPGCRLVYDKDEKSISD